MYSLLCIPPFQMLGIHERTIRLRSPQTSWSLSFQHERQEKNTQASNYAIWQVLLRATEVNKGGKGRLRYYCVGCLRLTR